MNTKKIAVFISLLLFSSALQLRAQDYKNFNLPIEERVKDLVKRMTLKEKVSQLGHTADAIPPWFSEQDVHRDRGASTHQ